MGIKYIVTHAGAAHRDELLSCALLVARSAYGIPIYRRDPTPEELGDPDVYVVDVGREYDDSLHNFDHHQFPQDQGPVCALTLVLRHLGLEEDAREALVWLNDTEFLDCEGPYQWAKAHKMSWDTVQGIASSPVEGWLLNTFGSRSEIEIHDAGPDGGDAFLQDVLSFLGASILHQITDFKDRQRQLAERTKTGMVKELVVVDASFIHRDNKPTFGLEAWCKKNCAEAAITITQDDRGDGLCLFRRCDHPQVDFTRIEKEPGVVFAHPKGFVAKLQKDIDPWALIALAVK